MSEATAAGRELAQLDADVERLVFGREVLGMAACRPWQDGTGYYVDDEQASRPDHVMRPVYVGPGCYGLGRCTSTDPATTVFGHWAECLEVVPAYSTDLASAWLVVERMRDRWEFRLTRWHEDLDAPEWCALFFDRRLGSADGEVYAETAPLAICRAALAAAAAASRPGGGVEG